MSSRRTTATPSDSPAALRSVKAVLPKAYPSPLEHEELVAKGENRGVERGSSPENKCEARREGAVRARGIVDAA